MKKRIGYRAKDSISEGGATGSWGARATFKMKKLLKIGEKQSKISSSSKIGEVQTRSKKSTKNQKVAKPTRSATEVKANHDVFKRAATGRNLRTHSGGNAAEVGAIKKYIKARGPFSPQGLEKISGIPSSTGRLLKQKRVLKNQKVDGSAKKVVPKKTVEPKKLPSPDKKPSRAKNGLPHHLNIKLAEMTLKRLKARVKNE